MEPKELEMKSSKFTMSNLKVREDDWKKVILINELTLINRFAKEGFSVAYEKAQLNAWIIKTLVNKKQRYKFKTCKHIVLVGSGLYPYSMFDLHKQYPHIKQVGLEIDKNHARISRKLIKASPAKNNIKIISIDGIDFDYSWLLEDDFVFISVDVDGQQIFNKVLETSKAQPLMCAPYKYSWLKNLSILLSSETSLTRT